MANGIFELVGDHENIEHFSILMPSGKFILSSSSQLSIRLLDVNTMAIIPFMDGRHEKMNFYWRGILSSVGCDLILIKFTHNVGHKAIKFVTYVKHVKT